MYNTMWRDIHTVVEHGVSVALGLGHLLHSIHHVRCLLQASLENLKRGESFKL